MAGSKRSRRAPRKKADRLRLLRAGPVRDFVELALMLGILYFFFSGAMTLALRTNSYWVAVVSQSMKHDGDAWRQYYITNGIDTSGFPLQGGFERGDLLILQGLGSFYDLKVGDVVVLDEGSNVIPLVHRVVSIWYENGEPRFTTKGDANSSSLLIEKSNRPEQIIGKAIFVVPKLGYVSLWFQGQ